MGLLGDHMTQEKTLEELRADLEAKTEALVDWCNKTTEVPYCQDEVVAVEAALERLYRLRKGQAEQPAAVQETAPSGIALAAIGHKHFGSPIPKEWYAAAKELLASTPPAAPVQEPSEMDLQKCWVEKSDGTIDGIASMRLAIRKYSTTPPAAQPAAPEEIMHWDGDDGEDGPSGDIASLLNNIVSNRDLEVGEVVHITRATRLPDVWVRVTKIPEDADVEYEVIPAAPEKGGAA
jgi:hypothetical protein